jgi:D-alanine--poly(phosphoribitol) ligase subunit 2
MAHDLATVSKHLKEHIEGEILLRKAPLAPDEDLFAAGFDSMSLSRVLVFVEERFGLAIPDQDVVLDEVSTIDTMARFVHGRLAAAGK